MTTRTRPSTARRLNTRPQAPGHSSALTRVSLLTGAGMLVGTLSPLALAPVLATPPSYSTYMAALDPSASGFAFDDPRNVRQRRGDVSGDVYVADFNLNAVIKIHNGVPSTYATVNGASDIAWDSSGNAFITSETDQVVYKRDASTGTLTVFAGVVGSDGLASAGLMSYPTSVVIDSSDNLYVVSRPKNQILKIDPAGAISLFAGDSGGAAESSAAVGSYSSATGAKFFAPWGLAINPANNDLYLTSRHAPRHTIQDPQDRGDRPRS